MNCTVCRKFCHRFSKRSLLRIIKFLTYLTNNNTNQLQPPISLINSPTLPNIIDPLVCFPSFRFILIPPFLYGIIRFLD